MRIRERVNNVMKKKVLWMLLLMQSMQLDKKSFF